MQTQNRENTAWTVGRLIDWTRGHFRERGLESPRLCAELLLAHTIKCDRIQLYTRWDQVPDDAARSEFRKLVVQASEHRPIAYLLRTKDFFSMAFEVNPQVLIPRPETEILVERALQLARDTDGTSRILDLCTGSGCIAVAIATHLSDAAFAATDLSAAALVVARRNAERHELADRISFYEGDLFEAVPRSDRFDIIVCNPPYIAESEASELPRNVSEHEPRAALFGGPDGLDVIRRVVDGAAERLLPSGHLLIEVAYNQASIVQALFEDADWCSVVSYRDLAGHERVIHATRSAEIKTQVA